MANVKWLASLVLYTAARKLDSVVGWLFRQAGNLDLEPFDNRVAADEEPAEPAGTVYDVALTDYARRLRIVPSANKAKVDEEPLEGSLAARTRKRF